MRITNGVLDLVVCINPEELHFHDVAYIDDIYNAGGRKRDKKVHLLNFCHVSGQ